MARRFLFLFALLFALAASDFTWADDVGIIATVNNDIITTHELSQRMEMLISANGLQHTDEVRKDIAPQVLHGLIDDKLRLQAAEASNIKVTDEDIRRGISAVAGQNKMSVDQFTDMLGSQGIDKLTLENQLRAEIAWQKYTEQRLVPNVDVPSSEIDRMAAQIKGNANRTEYLIAEIFLPVDAPVDEAKTKDFGDSLIRQIGGGTKFSALAHSFSASASASRNGDLGWQSLAQMPPEVARVIKVMHAGQISKPIRNLRGYNILYLRDTRTLNADALPDRSKLQEAAFNQQVDLLQRRELRDLRNKAFLEVKQQ